MAKFPYRCFACMHSIDTQQAICPNCGYDNHVRHNGVGYLPETLLHNQYLIGKALGCGGFGVTYLGYDLILNRIIAIKEYFPRNLATRDSQAMSLRMFTGCEGAFKNGCAQALRESRIAAALGRIQIGRASCRERV